MSAGQSRVIALATLGAAAMAFVWSFLAYRLGPEIALAATAGTTVAIAVLRTPILGVYTSMLAIPLEILDLRFGGEAGLSPAEGLLILTAIAAAFRMLVLEQGRSVPSELLWFGGFLVVVSLGIFFAEEQFVVAKATLMWTAFLAVALYISTLQREQLDRVVGSVALSGGIVGLIAMLTTKAQELSAGGTLATNRAEATFAHPNVLSFALILAIPLALTLGVRGRGAVRVLMLVSAALATGGLMLSLSRGGIVGGVVSFLVLLAWPRFRRYAFGLLALFALYAAFNLGNLHDTSALANVGERVGTLTTKKGVGNNPRIKIWSATPGIVIDHPLLGVGQGNYPEESVAYGIRDVGGLAFDHAHNLPLTIVAETGLIGLVLFGGFFVSVARSARTALRERLSRSWPPALAIVAALTGLLVSSIGEYPLRTNVITATILIEVGALAGYVRLLRQDLGGGDVL